MKLTLLEDGVLDYKGPGLSYPNGGVGNPVPAGSMKGPGVKPAPNPQEESLSSHLLKCKKCRGGTKCDVAKTLE